MPKWIRDAVIKRFDERAIQSEKIVEIETISKRLMEMEREILVRLSAGDQQFIHDWLELYVRMTSIQNEWLYLKGIQDGMHILRYAQLD